MNLFDFNERFPNEAACEAYLKLKREEEGIICSKCHESNYHWYENQKMWTLVKFVSGRPGGRGVITNAENIERALRGETGTWIEA